MILEYHSIERGGRWDDWVLDGDAVWPFVILVGIGATLRLVQFAANASLWLDEVALVKGIVDLNVSQLITQPLPYDQVAPKGFLLVQKLAVTTLGSTDWVLGLFPFVCSLSLSRAVRTPDAAHDAAGRGVSGCFALCRHCAVDLLCRNG